MCSSLFFPFRSLLLRVARSRTTLALRLERRRDAIEFAAAGCTLGRPTLFGEGPAAPQSPGDRDMLKSSGKIQAKTPQEVKTTPSRNDLDLVKTQNNSLSA